LSSVELIPISNRSELTQIISKYCKSFSNKFVTSKDEPIEGNIGAGGMQYPGFLTQEENQMALEESKDQNMCFEEQLDESSNKLIAEF
jgi:hypothetical protein